MDGFVSFFRGRPKGVFPQHRPPGDAPEIRVVVPKYISPTNQRKLDNLKTEIAGMQRGSERGMKEQQLANYQEKFQSSDPLRPIVRDCCKFNNYKPKVKKPRNSNLSSNRLYFEHLFVVAHPYER